MIIEVGDKVQYTRANGTIRECVVAMVNSNDVWGNWYDLGHEIPDTVLRRISPSDVEKVIKRKNSTAINFFLNG